MSPFPIRVAVVGLGKIARDQHLPAIAENERFALAATVDPRAEGTGAVPHFADLASALAAAVPIDAVALCTPPQLRHRLARAALAQGLHVLLEKPPAASLAELDDLTRQAMASGASLFAAWHSRFAPGVAPARAWLAGRTLRNVAITWREDVRIWHPGQAWIWEPGGLGVFDPGINALSIASSILPHPLIVEEAVLTFPDNRAAPIAARLRLADTAGTAIEMDLDWRQTGPQTWTIEVETDAGRIVLAEGGAALHLPDTSRHDDDLEYPALYEHFAGLVARGQSDVDAAPFRLVADAFLIGRRETTDAFDD